MFDPNDPQRRSFIPVAAESDFPIQNLPYGAFYRPGVSRRHLGVAIGDKVLDLTVLEQHRLIDSQEALFQDENLNPFLAQGQSEWQRLRRRISELLGEDCPELRDQAHLCEKVLLEQKDLRLELPLQIGDYTDFYASKEHASNVGAMFRDKDNPLLPNWLHLPVGYHGRASSVVVSGTPIRRPQGQLKPPSGPLDFGASQRLDFELEVGYFVGPGNSLGQRIPLGQAQEQIFGLVLLNDWSARDIQKWEYQPLGPFVSKSFATSISPWVISAAALEPFRVPGPVQDPVPLDYLQQSDKAHNYDVDLEVSLTPSGGQSEVICRSNLKYLYWSLAQQVCHHTVTGCPLRPGDLLATGTISGPSKDSWGSMLELAWGGQQPLVLSGGEQRSFLLDGDKVVFNASCQGEGYRIGWGEVAGEILPAE